MSEKNKFYLKRLLAITGLILLYGCKTEWTASQSTPEARIQVEDCVLAAPESRQRIKAKCGQLPVPENPDDSGGKKINLAIAVLPAIRRNSSPDPLFFLTGGPGQAASESFVQMYNFFLNINQKRDIVLVDQRGTGKSNPLRCEYPPTADYSPEFELSPFLESCLKSIDAEPQFYTTEIAMQDLDIVREALGYEKINIYGLSYGTRAGLNYLRMYPERVRSIILDGVAPPQISLGLSVAKDAERSLNLIFHRCQSEPSCNENFPDVAIAFDEILANLEKSPASLRISHPVSGKMIDLIFTKDMFTNAIRLLTYAPETAALIPLIIHSAAVEQDYSLLASQYLMVIGSLNSSIANGMGYSVLCSEDVAFYSPEEAHQANVDSYIGDSQTDALFEICKVWPHGQISVEFKEAVHSSVPILLLSGEYDPVTPPEFADLASETLSNSLNLVINGQGHNVFIRGCVWRLGTDFIETARFDNFDHSCLDKIEPFPFFINFSGPLP